MLGNRYRGVVPVAQGALIDGVLVMLIALERYAGGTLLTARVTSPPDIDRTLPPDDPNHRCGRPVWPRLDLAATDDTGTEFHIDGGNGMGGGSDYHLQFGLIPAIADEARWLDIIMTKLSWKYLGNGSVEDPTIGSWTFPIDLTRQLDARTV